MIDIRSIVFDRFVFVIVDIWSVGCIMVEFIRGVVMFFGSDRIFVKVIFDDNVKEIFCLWMLWL